MLCQKENIAFNSFISIEVSCEYSNECLLLSDVFCAAWVVRIHIVLLFSKMKITNFSLESSGERKVFVPSLTCDEQLSVCCTILLRVFKQQAAGLL